MRNSTMRTENKPQAIVHFSEVRYRAKGTRGAFRPATILAGTDALQKARELARDFASTYGDLEFAVFTDSEMLEQVCA